MPIETTFSTVPQAFALFVVLKFISQFCTGFFVNDPVLTHKTAVIFNALSNFALGLLVFNLCEIGWSIIAHNFSAYIPWLAGV